MTKTINWPWYYAKHKEETWSGPHSSRDDAISCGKDKWDGDEFFICQATNPPILLRDWISADSLLELAEESIFDDCRANSDYDDLVFNCTDEQQSDLVSRIKKTCDEWQGAHNLKFSCNTFESMTGVEPIAGVATDD